MVGLIIHHLILSPHTYKGILKPQRKQNTGKESAPTPMFGSEEEQGEKGAGRPITQCCRVMTATNQNQIQSPSINSVEEIYNAGFITEYLGKDHPFKVLEMKIIHSWVSGTFLGKRLMRAFSDSPGYWGSDEAQLENKLDLYQFIGKKIHILKSILQYSLPIWGESSCQVWQLAPLPTESSHRPQMASLLDHTKL